MRINLTLLRYPHDEYTATVGDDSKNHKSIWISFCLYSKIRVNNNSHRFVIIKPQGIFVLSKNTLPSKFCLIYFVFVQLRNFPDKKSRNLHYKQNKNKSGVTIFYEFFQDFWGLIITNLHELLLTPILKNRLSTIQIDMWFLETSPPVSV